MSKSLQLRKGTTAEHAVFTGLLGEMTVDTTRSIPVVHDGVTPGGYPVIPVNILKNTNDFNIQTPAFVTPLNNAGGFTGAVQGTPYMTQAVFEGVHTATDWQVATDVLFANIIQSSVADTINLEQITFLGLTAAVPVYLRFRYVSGEHLSEYSVPVFVTPMLRSIQTPTISVQGAPNVQETPLLTGSTYTTSNSSEPHLSTNWTVQNQLGTVVWSSIQDTQNLESIQLPANVLAPGMLYTFNVSYHSISLQSNVGTIRERTATVFSNISTPVVTVVGDPNNVLLNPVIQSSPYNTVGATLPHTSTDWRVLDSQGTVVWSSLLDTQNLESVQVPNNMLRVGTAYTFEVVYRSLTLVSLPGVLLTKTVTPFIVTPLLSVQGSPLNVPENPILTTSTYSVVGSNEIHSSTDWTVQNSAGVTVWTSLNDTSNLNVIQIPKGILTENTAYVFKAVFHSTNVSSLPGSAGAQTVVNYPTIITPTVTVQGGPSNVPITPFVYGSNFAAGGTGETHTSSDWSVTNSVGTTIWSSNSTQNLTSVQIPSGVVQVGGTYTFSVVYHSATLTSGKGSISAGTIAAYLNAPTIQVQGSPSAVPENPVLTTGTMSAVGNAGTHVSTDWEIKNSAGGVVWSSTGDTVNKTSIAVPRGILTTQTTYTFTAVHHSSTSTSPLSSVQGTTKSQFASITTPSVTVQGAPTAVPESPTLTGSPFNITGTTETHASTDWVVMNSAGTTVWSSPADTVNLVFVKLPKGILLVGTTYTFTVKYNTATLTSLLGSTTGTTLSAFALVLAGVWLAKAPMPSTKYYSSQSTLLNGDVLVTGGWLTGTIVYQYNFTANTWTTKAPLPASLISHGQSTLLNGDVLVTGGGNALIIQKTAVSTVFQYNLALNTWTAKAPLPVAISDHGQSTLLNGDVLISTSNSVYQYNLALDTWTQKASMPVTLVDNHGQSTLLNGDVLVTEGPLSQIFGGVYQYNVALDTWTQKTSMPAYMNGHNQSTLLNGDVLITGGWYNVYLSSVYQFDVALNTWTQKASMPAAKYRHSQSTLLDGTVLVTGGITSSSIISRNVFQYT